MFGAKYTRLTFWIWSVILLIPLSIFSTFSRVMEMNPETAASSLIFRGLALIVVIMWLNALANRIRDYGSNPWIAVFAIIPLANIGLALYYGIVKYKDNPKPNNNTTDTSLTKAVYNHTKDVISEIKPTIQEYKEKHKVSNDDNAPLATSTNIATEATEDAIYEQVMLEIEEDRKVKSTWAKALAQSDGNREKTEALYIKLRVQNIKSDLNNDIKNERLKLIEEQENILYSTNNEKEPINENNKFEFKDTKENEPSLLFIAIFWILFFTVLIKLTN